MNADVLPMRGEPVARKPPPAKRPKKDRTAAERSRRAREKRKAQASVTPSVTPVTATSIPAYMAAVGLAGAAAFFSIKGMVTLFPGAPEAVVGMACAMEGAKLVTAGWLARRWRSTTAMARTVLVTL